MANDFSSAFQILQQPFAEALVAGLEPLSAAGLIRGDQTRTLESSVIFETDTDTTMADETTTVTPVALKSGKVSFSPTDKAKSVKLKWGDYADLTPQQIADIGRQMGARAAARLAGAFWTGLDVLQSTAHPLAGAGLGQVGAGKKCIDTDLVGNQTLGSTFTQSTKFGVGFGASSLQAMCAALRTQKVYSGEPLMAGLSGLLLCVHSNIRDDAARIIGSTNLGVDGGINVQAGRYSLLDYPRTSEAYFDIIDPVQMPVQLWVREAPVITIASDPQNTVVYFTTRYRGAAVYSPTVLGIVGSRV